MPVLIDHSLPKVVSRLPANEAKQVWGFLTKFLEDPAHPSLKLERINRTQNKNLWSARISRDLRAIVYKDGDVWSVLYADHHDAAYHWATTKQISRHSHTGVLQIVQSPEIAEVQFQKDQTFDRELPGIFDDHKDEYLVSLGVPNIWLPTLRKLKTEEMLLDVVFDLPEDVGERLLSLADGNLVTPPPPLLPDQSIVQSTEVQRRFFVLNDNADLMRMLEAPLETWIAFLHPSQETLALGDVPGPLKVTGGAGTGKTVVALHRARYLARKGKRVLLTSYVKTLCENIQKNLALLCTPEEQALITVSTIHSLGLKIASEKGNKISPIDENQIRQYLEDAHVPSCPLDTTMLFKEWEMVIQDLGISSWEKYKTVSRTGRGFSLSTKGREQVWPILERVLKTIQSQGKADWSTICRQSREFIQAGVVESPYDAVVVDELQDLRPQEIQLLAALAGNGPNALTLVGDGAQRIYGSRFSLKSLGVNVQGRSHILRINYRTTEEIRRFADRLIGETGDDLDGGTEQRRGMTSLLRGPHPTLHQAKTPTQQWKFIIDQIKRMKKEGLNLNEIAIFSRTKSDLEQIEKAMTRNRIQCHHLSQDEPMTDGVRLGTLHRSKGLEFKAVFVANVSDEKLPLRLLLQNIQDQQLRTEILDRERQLLYVGMTRARDEVVLTWTGYPSRFLEDILTDPELEALAAEEA